MVKVKDFLKILPKYEKDCAYGKKGDCVLRGISWTLTDNSGLVKNQIYALSHSDLRRALSTTYGDYNVNITEFVPGSMYAKAKFTIEIIEPKTKKGMKNNE